MSKTVKQIADELGVSKTAVSKKIANLGLRSGLRKNGNQFAINKTQENLIKSAFLENESETKSQTSLRSETETALVDMLQRELEIKNKQIDELNARLAEMSCALVAAQQTAQAAQVLHAGTMQRLEGGDWEEEETQPTETQKKKRWWQR